MSLRWHLGYCNSSYLPTNRGFDTQYGFYNSQINNYAKTYNFAPFPFDFFENDKIVPVTDLRSRFGFQGVRGVKCIDLFFWQSLLLSHFGNRTFSGRGHTKS